MDFLTKAQAKTINSSFNGFTTISLNDEDKYIEEQIKNQKNVYIKNDLGSLDLGKPEFEIEFGELRDLSQSQRVNEGVIEKTNSWMGGMFGRQPIVIDMAHYGLFGKEAGWGKYVPWNTAPWEEVEKERKRYDDNFVKNKDKEIDIALEQRYGADQANKIKEIIREQNGDDWKKTFAVGTNNSNAFLEQVQKTLSDKSLETAQRSRLQSQIQGYRESLLDRFSLYSKQNLLLDYDMAANVALTIATEGAFAGGIPAIGNLSLVAARAPGYAALKIPTALGGIRGFSRLNGFLGRRTLERIFPRQASMYRQLGDNFWKSLGKEYILNQGHAYRVGVRAVEQGAVIRPALNNKATVINPISEHYTFTPLNQATRRISNPFNPITQLRKFLQFNKLRVLNAEGTVLKEGLAKNKILQLMNNVGLGIDEYILVGKTTTLAEAAFKTGISGGVMGFADGFSNSIFSQQEAAEQSLLQKNKDVSGFDLSQALSDGATFAAFGALLGGGLGSTVFSPYLLSRAAMGTLDGRLSLGTKDARRGLFQLIGKDRMSAEQFESLNKVAKVLGVRGTYALELAKKTKLQQLREIIVHLTGDRKSGDFYLDPNFLAEHDISEHEVGSLVTTVIEILSKSSPEYSVNPLSNEMFGEVVLGLAKAKRLARESGSPLSSATDVDIITGVEVKEKLVKYGLLEAETEVPISGSKKNLTPEEIAIERNKVNEKIRNGETTLEEAESSFALLNKAEERNNTKQKTQKELNDKIAERDLLTQQYPDETTRSKEISNKIKQFDNEVEELFKKTQEGEVGISSSVTVETNKTGSITRIKVSGYDISDTKAGFLLTQYLDANRNLIEAQKITDLKAREKAVIQARERLDLIEKDMDASFKLREDGATRQQIRTEWFNEKWNKLKENPRLLAQFTDALSKQIDVRKASIGERAVAMNWYGEIRNASGLGKALNRAATYGSGTADNMYQTIDILFEAFRMVDDGQFFAYSDLANPYNALTIKESIEVGLRKAATINQTVSRIKKQYGNEAAAMINQRVITARRSGKEIDSTGLSKELLEEAKLLLNQNNDFYLYSAQKAKEIGKVYDDAFTYIPQMLSKYLDPSEVDRLAELGYKAMKAKVLKEGIVSYAELERLGLIVRDDTGAIVEIPESSIFYLVDKEGSPLSLDQMISRIPKTLDEFRLFEAQRRVEAGKLAQLPNDLKDALTSRVRMATLTPEEKAKIVTALKTNIGRHLERSKAGIAPENDLYFAATQLLLLKQRATEWGDEATISWVNKTIEDLNTDRGIEINDNPKNPVVVELNNASNIKPEDKPTLKTIYVSSPEIKIGKTTITKEPSSTTGIENIPETIDIVGKNGKEFKAIRVKNEAVGSDEIYYTLTHKGLSIGFFHFIWDPINKAFRPLEVSGGIRITRTEHQGSGLYPKLLEALSNYVDLGSTTTMGKIGTADNAAKVWKKLGAPVEKLKEPFERVDLKDNVEAYFLRRRNNKNKTTVIHPGRVYKQWLPEAEVVLPDGKPSLVFTTKLSEDALASGVHSTKAQQLGYEYSMAVVSKHLANMFGESEPTSFNPRFISINTLENSFVTFENLIAWSNSDVFKSQVDKLASVMVGISKTDIGMMILGGWLLKAKNHNLKIMKTMTPENQATLLQEFNNIAFTTLRARYDGNPISLDSTKLFQDTFVDRLARGTKTERMQAMFGYDNLWTPESELNPLITLSPSKGEQVSEGVAEASSFWKQMQTRGKEVEQLDRKLNRYLGYQRDLESFTTARNKPDISEINKKALDNKIKKIQSNLKKEKVTNLDKRIKELEKKKKEILTDRPSKVMLERDEVFSDLDLNEIARLYYYYLENAPKIVGLSGLKGDNVKYLEPLTGFLLSNLSDKAQIANKIGELKSLGIDPEHMLQDGSLSLEGQKAYLKRLANSDQAKASEARFKESVQKAKANRTPKVSQESATVKEYYEQRGAVLEELQAARDTIYFEEQLILGLTTELDNVIGEINFWQKSLIETVDINSIRTKLLERQNFIYNRVYTLNKELDKLSTAEGAIQKDLEYLTTTFKNDLLGKAGDFYEGSAQAEFNSTIRTLEFTLENLKDQRNKFKEEINKLLKEVGEIELPQEGRTYKTKREIEKLEQRKKQLEETINTTSKNNRLTAAELKLKQIDEDPKYQFDWRLTLEEDGRLEKITLTKTLLEKHLAKLKELRSMNQSDFSNFNRQLAEIESQIGRLSTAIGTLQNAGATVNRQKYTTQLKKLIEEQAKYIQELQQVQKNSREFIFNQDVNNFEVVYNWLDNTIATLEEKNDSISKVMRRVWETKSAQTLGFDVFRRNFSEFIEDQSLIVEGLSLGILFQRIDSPLMQTVYDVVDGNIVARKVGTKQEGPVKSRLVAYDLKDSVLTPIDFTGDIKAAKLFLEKRKAFNLENPESQITLEKIIEKYSTGDKDSIPTTTVRMLKMLNKWMKDKEQSFLEAVGISGTELFALDSNAFQKLLEDVSWDTAKRSFNLLAPTKEITKNRVREIQAKLKLEKTEAETTLEIKLKEIEDKIQKTAKQFYEDSLKKQVPVYNKERQAVIKDLLKEKKKLQNTIISMGSEFKEPTQEEIASGIKLGDLEINKEVSRIGELWGYLYDLLENKPTTVKQITGSQLETISKKELQRLAKERGMKVSELKADMESQGLTIDEATKYQILSNIEITIKGEKQKLPPVLVKAKNGRYVLNTDFTVTDFAKLAQYAAQTNDARQYNLVQELFKQQAKRKARNIVQTVSQEMQVRNTEVEDAFQEFWALVYGWNNAANDTDIGLSLENINEKIRLLEEQNPDLEYADSSIKDQLDRLRSVKKSILMPSRFKTQSYGKVNPKTGDIELVTDESVRWSSIPGQPYPQTNMNIKTAVNRVANDIVYLTKQKGLFKGKRVTTMEDLDGVIRFKFDESEIRDRGFSSDFRRPDEQLSEQETNARLQQWVDRRKEFIDSAPGLVQRVLKSGQVNEFIYNEFFQVVISVLQQDIKRLENGETPLFLTKGEKDRITQRTVVGTIKNQNELFDYITELLQKRFTKNKVDQETNKFRFYLGSQNEAPLEFVIDRSLIEQSFRQLKKEARIVKADLLSTSSDTKDVFKTLLERVSKGLEGGELYVATDKLVPEQFGAWDGTLSEQRILQLISGITTNEESTKLSFGNFKTIKDIKTGQRIGGRYNISYADLKQRAITGKLLDMKMFDITNLFDLKIGSSTEKDLYFKKIITQVQEQYQRKLEQLTDSTANPDIFIRWALSELLELKGKVKESTPKMTAELNELNHSFNVMEYETLSGFLDNYLYTRNKSIGNISNEEATALRKASLLESGFSGQVQSAVNVDNIMYKSIREVDRNSPFGEIVQYFNKDDMHTHFELLSGILLYSTPKELFNNLPQSSVVSTLKELEELGLIDIIPQTEKELIDSLLSNTELDRVFTVTNNGLEILKVTRHNDGYRRGYYGARNVEDTVNETQLKKLISDKAPSETEEMRNLLLESYNNNLEKIKQESTIHRIEELTMLAARRQVVEKQLQILDKLDTSNLNVKKLLTAATNSIVNDEKNRNIGYKLLDLFNKKEKDLKEELVEINQQIAAVRKIDNRVEPVKKLPKKLKQQAEEPRQISYKPWSGADSEQSLYSKLLSAYNGDTSNYVGKFKNASKTGLEEDMKAWAYGMNNTPYSKPTTLTSEYVERKRPISYEALGKPVFSNEDLLIPENAELAGMLSSDTGELALRYARTSLAKNSADAALKARIKQRYGFDLPEGFGWGEWVDYLRDVVAKFETNPPRLADGKVDTTTVEHMREMVEGLNHWVNQNTAREVSVDQMPRGMKRFLRNSKNLTIGLLGPGMGLSVLLGELPFALFRKNGSIKSMLKGLETLLGQNPSKEDIKNTIFAYDKIMRGFQSKFGGEGVLNNELTYLKRLQRYFTNMFNPDPAILESSGTGKLWAYVDNFLANKAALSMELGGMSTLVEKTLQIAYEKEKVNLFQVKDRLVSWVKAFDTENFRRLAEASSNGDKGAQTELIKLFKAVSREYGIPIEVASYLWMSKLGNTESISRLVNLMNNSQDGLGSFDLSKASKNVIQSDSFGVVNKVNKDLDNETLAKLSYYLELQARNASPEPFGTGSVTFKYNKGNFGSIITFLASYPIAAYQTYIIRNGTTHTAAAMISVALGIMGFEILTKRLKDVIAGKKDLNSTFEEYKKSPMAFFLRDLSYSQMGGLLDQFLNPLYIQGGKALLNKGVKADPKDFPPFAPEVGDIPAFTGINGLLRQLYQATGGLMKGDPTETFDALGNLATEGTVGKYPTDLLKSLFNLQDKTKVASWAKAINEYGKVDPNEPMMHDLLRDTLIKKFIFEQPEWTPLEDPKMKPMFNRSPEVKVPKVTLPRPLDIPQPTKSQPKGRQSPVTPNIINSLINEKGVSPLLVDELIKEMNK